MEILDTYDAKQYIRNLTQRTVFVKCKTEKEKKGKSCLAVVCGKDGRGDWKFIIQHEILLNNDAINTDLYVKNKCPLNAKTPFERKSYITTQKELLMNLFI